MSSFYHLADKSVSSLFLHDDNERKNPTQVSR